MKPILYLLLILSTNSILAQAVMESPKDETLAALEATNIAKQDRLAYEQLAIQKLRDVLDYIQLVATADLPPEMRQTAKEEVLRQIAANQVQPASWLLLPKSKKKQTTQALLHQLIKTSTNYQLQYQNIQVAVPLQPVSPQKYTGILSYEQKLLGEEAFRKITIEVNLTKTTKVFGTEKMEVWQVSFGMVSD